MLVVKKTYQIERKSIAFAIYSAYSLTQTLHM